MTTLYKRDKNGKLMGWNIWHDGESYELIHTKSDHEFYNNRRYLKLYLKSYSSKTNKEK